MILSPPRTLPDTTLTMSANPNPNMSLMDGRIIQHNKIRMLSMGINILFVTLQTKQTHNTLASHEINCDSKNISYNWIITDRHFHFDHKIWMIDRSHVVMRGYKTHFTTITFHWILTYHQLSVDRFLYFLPSLVYSIVVPRYLWEHSNKTLWLEFLCLFASLQSDNFR